MAICRTIIGCVAIHFSLAIMVGAGGPSFTYYDIGYLGLPIDTQALDINDFGVVGGYSKGWHAVFPSAITWKNGVVTDHTDSIPAGWFAGIVGISEKGPMVGSAWAKNEGALWRDGVGYLADIPPGCEKNDNLEAINASGTLGVGSCIEDDPDANIKIPTLYFIEDGSALVLGFLPDTPEGTQGWAFDVNDSGIVVGYYDDGRGYYWQDGRFTVIPNVLNDGGVTAGGVNNGGVIAGTAGSQAMTFDINTGLMTDLGTGSARDINEARAVVGAILVPLDGAHAVLYEDGEIIDLHDLILDQFFEDSDANAINNYGWIVGHGDDFDNNNHGWLLVPNRPKGDFDGDSDVDLQDSGHFQRCFAAEPYIDGTLHVGCSVFDFDDDVDLDLTDYAAFQSAFTGPGAPHLDTNSPG